MKKSVVLVLSTMMSAFLVAACTGDSTQEPSTGTTPKGDGHGGTGGTGTDPTGSSCEPFCDGQALMGCANEGTFQIRLCGKGEFCDESVHDCSCVLNEVRCIAGNNSKEQVCVPGPGGSNKYDTEDCHAGDICVDPVGCTGCDCECLEGNMKCAPDGITVEVCQSNGSGTSCGGTCGVFKENITCTDLGMVTCSPPPAGTEGLKVKDFCVNECGARGVSLTGELCEQAPGLPCAQLVCTSGGAALLPDHTDCRDANKPCENSSQCMSCNCVSGLCQGSFVKQCEAAEEQCPPQQ